MKIFIPAVTTISLITSGAPELQLGVFAAVTTNIVDNFGGRSVTALSPTLDSAFRETLGA